MSSPPQHAPSQHPSPRQDPCAVVRVAGEVDLDTADRFRRAVDDVPDGGTDLVIDLREVTFMSCAGLPVLLAAQQRFGPRVQFLGPCPAVSRLLTCSGLDAGLVLAAATEASGAVTPAGHRVGSRAS